MDFESLDAYLLDGMPPKAEVVRQLLENRPNDSGRAHPISPSLRCASY
jgi:hypothetical protein